MTKMQDNLGWLFRYIAPSAIILACTLRVIYDSSLNNMSYSLVCSAILLAIVAVYLRSRKRIILLWNEERGQLAIIRPTSIQIVSMMLFGSVPIGIDLSRNAAGVLRAMYQVLRTGTHHGELRFVLYRPVDNGPSRLGFMVVRSMGNIASDIKAVSKLSDEVLEDSIVLRSSMNASYPHVPVIRADKSDMLSALSGGTVRT